jgi:ATP-dependent helicase/nuclease subunit A
MTVRSIRAIVASAGAGKTTRIVGEIAAEVGRRAPEEIVATTFTTKAADELVERSRAALYAADRPREAARLLGARFGTVNAVCGQIVSEYALALGRSPKADVIAEDEVARTFAIAADPVIERHAPRLNELADAMGFFEPRRAADAERSDWRTTIRRIIELARANGIAPDSLSISAERSVCSFLELLPATSSPDGASLDAELAAALRDALPAVPEVFSATAKGSVETLRRACACVDRGERLSWPDWARLTKLGCAKKDGSRLADALQAVCRAAGRHAEHPRLQEECTDFIRTMFACAADALSSYQNFKAERGLLDFVDQEALALEVLRDPTLSARLGERIGRVFVDEFQDSSPLQIAIFTELSRLADASTWVGDPKQAIYGFRNADSVLTQAAFAGVAESDEAPPEVLATSYRSRAEIVDLVNAAFGPALDAMGLPGADHLFAGTARSEEGFSRKALSVWWLEGKLELQYAALAAAIRHHLNAELSLEVGAKPDGVRPIRAGDIAILCRSRGDVAKVSMALARQGLRVAVEREGLCRTPHVELVLAALRWVVDPGDRLALTELARFFSDDPESSDWLSAITSEDAEQALRSAVPICDALIALHQGGLSRTPAEIIDAIILLPALTRRIEAWGNLAGRLDDLEALRGYARAYEASCLNAGAPATASGLVLALAEGAPKRPRSLRDDAVKVMTYHGAKGLEWPLVVMTGLGKEPIARLFEPVAEADGEIDWRDPLVGRWIRYWPWPYASQEKGVHLDSTAPDSPLGVQARRRIRDEEARLLYVGATRARDYLVFAPPAKGTLHWMGVLDGGAQGHVVLPRTEGEGIRAGSRTLPADVAVLADSGEVVARPIERSHVRVDRPVAHRPPLVLRPSGAATAGSFAIAEKLVLGPRLALLGSPDMATLGEAVHAILAADRTTDELEVRLRRAEGILNRWKVSQVAAPEVLAASDRLFAEIEKRWPAARLLRETPVTARVGEQIIRGRMDMFVAHDRGAAIIDHKSFPGSPDMWDERAISYAPQLALYSRAIKALRPEVEVEAFVHMPIVGVLLRLAPQ